MIAKTRKTDIIELPMEHLFRKAQITMSIWETVSRASMKPQTSGSITDP